MNSLDSLLHLCRIILLSECMEYVVEGRRLAGNHFDVELIILVLLLSLFLKLVFPLLLRLHYWLLDVVHHLVRLRDGAIIIIDRHDFTWLEILTCINLHIEDPPVLNGLLHDTHSIAEEILIRRFIRRTATVTLWLLLYRPSSLFHLSKVLIGGNIKSPVKAHHEVFLVREGFAQEDLVQDHWQALEEGQLLPKVRTQVVVEGLHVYLVYFQQLLLRRVSPHTLFGKGFKFFEVDRISAEMKISNIAYSG